MAKLTKSFKMETVTYNADQPDIEEPIFPEISGYGHKVEVEMFAYTDDPQSTSLVICIGKFMFLPSQILALARDIEDFQKMIKR